MPQQYLREVYLSVDDGARVIQYPTPNLTDSQDKRDGLRIRFWTQQFTSGTPANVRVWITNLSKSTAQRFLNKEYRKLQLQAGYSDGAYGIIFRGQIVFTRFFREDITDTVLEIVATSGETARNYATVNKALAAGSNADDHVQMAVDAFKELDVAKGYIEKLGGPKLPRNFVAHGMAHDLLREVCRARNAHWWIHDNRLYVAKKSTTVPGSGSIVLSSETGLVGLAEQTLDGVQFTCLLNVNIIPGSKVRIDQSSVTRASYDPAIAAADRNALLAEGGLMGVAADGEYKVLKIAQEGDTRGTNFYTHGVCVKLGADSIALRSIGISDDFGD